jgi:hypothetical protein
MKNSRDTSKQASKHARVRVSKQDQARASKAKQEQARPSKNKQGQARASKAKQEQARPSKSKQGQARVRVSKCKRRAQTEQFNEQNKGHAASAQDMGLTAREKRGANVEKMQESCAVLSAARARARCREWQRRVRGLLACTRCVI